MALLYRGVLTSFVYRYGLKSFKSSNKCYNVINGARFCTVLPPDKELLRTSDPDVILAELGKGDPEIENRLKLLMLEVDVMRQDGRKAPNEDYMQLRHWAHLLTLNSVTKRMSYLLYLFKNNMASENKKQKQAEKQKLFEQYKLESADDNEEDPEIKYKLGGNSMFRRISDTTINQGYSIKLHLAGLFGRKVVLDCSYSEHMTPREEINTAKQFCELFAANRVLGDPMDLNFCNFNSETITAKQFHRNMSNLYEPDNPVKLYKESYLDLFPKEKLVYLTPHCKTDLIYDPDDIYIVGAIVDKSHSQPLSLAKAKEYKLRMARFPLDRYLQWLPGSGKSLTLNHVIAILGDLDRSQNWEFALRHIPRRKIKTDDLKNLWNNNKLEDSKGRYIQQQFSKNHYNVKSNAANKYVIKNKKNTREFRSIQVDNLFP